MTKSKSIILNNITDPVNLPLDVIENAIRYKLSLLDESNDAYIILSYFDTDKRKRNLIKLSHITDLKTNIHFVLETILTALTICRVDNMRTLTITYGNLKALE